MNIGLQALLAALDAAPAPVSFFVRDDDAGWDDRSLFALLATTGRAAVPIDLAVIPRATGRSLAAELRACIEAAPGLVGVHQHGYAHVNHETEARKNEFGEGRPPAAQRADLRAGREHLGELFGATLDAIFTPPWNRCSAATPGLLVELGFTALSRDCTASAQHTLPELNVALDWCKERRLAAEEGDAGGERIALKLAQQVRAGGPVGLMLHHAAMPVSDFALLATLLEAIAPHPRSRFRPMRELLRGGLGEHGPGARDAQGTQSTQGTPGAGPTYQPASRALCR